ncbi:tetratricopeptide repeat protein [Myxosarcina sp. GI1(2024)]
MLNPKPIPTDVVPSSDRLKTIVHAPGAIVGRYQIIQQLSKGTADKTYLAKDLEINQRSLPRAGDRLERPSNEDSRCVIEQFYLWSDNSQPETDTIAKFARQLEILQRLGNRPQIPQYRTYFVENRQIYLVREYIDDEALKQKVKRRVFDEVRVIHLLHDVLKTLDLIHKNHLVHQAIEPAHLIERQENNSYVLLNFGAFKTIEVFQSSQQNPALASQFSTYVAPEQIVRKPRFNSDLYGLGKTAIYSLTGLSPRELEQTNTFWRRCCHISDKLAAVIEKMIAADCNQRYQTALEVLWDLKPLLIVGQIVDGRYRIIRHLQEKPAVRKTLPSNERGASNFINSYFAENLRRSYQSPCIVERVELSQCDAVSWEEIEHHLSKRLLDLDKLRNCPQISQLWDHFQVNGEFYLVKACVRGESLREILAKRKLSEAELVGFLESALTALGLIHQYRVIHRHLQPENLVIDQDERVILISFGILEDLQYLWGSNITDRRHVSYSAYLPPEQIAGRPTLSSDIYSLGIIAIEALTGIEPECLSRQQTGKLLWQKEVVNNRLAKIIDKMTALDLARRYQLVENVVRDLGKVEVRSARVTAAKLDKSKTGAPPSSSWSLQPAQMVLVTLGIASLLASIEFAFPMVRPMYYWYRGKQLLSEQPQIALNAFNQATEIQPNNSLAWEGKGDALYDLKRFPEAMAAYSEASKLNPSDFQIWKKRGDSFYRLESFPKALQAYNRALELQPNDGVALNSKGKTLENLQLYQEALFFQEAALKQDPLNPEFLSDRARVLISLGRYYDALTVLNRVQAIEPKSPHLWQDKVFALQALGRPQEADRVYREVLSTYQTVVEGASASSSYNLWLAQGDFLTELRTSQADGLFRQGASSNAYYSPLQIQSKALAAYEEVIATSSQAYLAWIGKARVLSASGEYEAALTALDRALQIRPHAGRPWQIRGSIFKDGLDRPEAAVEAYDRALAIEPDFAQLWRDRGLALSQAGQYALAISSFTKASQLNPRDSKTWIGLAHALQEVARSEEALSAIDRALALEPQNPSLWQTKGSILTKQQNYNAACDTYRESRQFAPNFAPITQAMNIVGCRMDGRD